MKRLLWRMAAPLLSWWMDRSEGRRMQVLRHVGAVAVPDYRFKHPEMAWWHDAAFTATLQRVGAINELNTDRMWNVSQLAKLVLDVPGDTAECGVFRGAFSYVICQQLGRRHHGFDSFEGLSEPSELDGGHWTVGDLAASEEPARSLLADFDVTLYRGWIPDRFPEVADRRFAFVHIDVDLYQPTRDSLAFFYPRMSPGGVIVVDDYGFTTCPGATRAVDDFMADKPEPVVALASGGGFIIARLDDLDA